MRVTREFSGRGDSGFTLVEVMIASALTAVVIASVLGVLLSQQRAEREVARYAENLQELREAIVLIQRDLRSAEHLVGVAEAPSLAYQVDLDVYESVHSIAPTRVRWRLDIATDELVRETTNSTGTVVTGTSYRLTGVANGDIGRPLFSYANADGDFYDLDLPAASAGTVAVCTVRMTIDLRAAPMSGRPVQIVSDVQMRNRLPGEDVCPG